MLTAIGLPAIILATSANSIVRTLFDDTFAGVHRLEWFDWSLLIPYFLLLVILSCYGCHRFEMIRRYFKYKKNILTHPPLNPQTLPPLTVQLPLYNERYVVYRLIDDV